MNADEHGFFNFVIRHSTFDIRYSIFDIRYSKPLSPVSCVLYSVFSAFLQKYVVTAVDRYGFCWYHKFLGFVIGVPEPQITFCSFAKN